MMPKVNWMTNGIIPCKLEASTSDFFEKFILAIIGPAFISEFEPAVNPDEKSCHEAIPKTAYKG